MRTFTKRESDVCGWMKKNNHRLSEYDKTPSVYYITDSWLDYARHERVYLMQGSPTSQKRKIGYYDCHFDNFIISDKTVLDEKSNKVLEQMNLNFVFGGLY